VSECSLTRWLPTVVIPAKAGIQCLLYERRWVPAFAGTTILASIILPCPLFVDTAEYWTGPGIGPLSPARSFVHY
jgi:hypothetical protein